jgi:hypothetical protein
MTRTLGIDKRARGRRGLVPFRKSHCRSGDSSVACYLSPLVIQGPLAPLSCCAATALRVGANAVAAHYSPQPSKISFRWLLQRSGQNFKSQWWERQPPVRL